MARDQAAIKAFSGMIKSGNSSYINAKSIDANGITIRPLGWSYNEKPVIISEFNPLNR